MAPLAKETVIGLTFGQIIALTTLFITIGISWTTTQAKMSEIQTKVQYLENSRNETNASIETLRRENRQEFQRIGDKMDLMLDKFQDVRK